MPEAIRAVNEAERLQSVQALRLLGTPAEERFDRITRLAQRVFNVPMAAIDIVGDKVAWLKSVQGFDGVAGIRKHSYCHHTVLSDEIFVVTDSSTDSRVSDSDYAANWVFYAGVPLRFSGHRVGVLCIGDTKPRSFSPDHFDSLRDLGLLVEDEFKIATLSEAQLALAYSHEELGMKTQIDVLTHAWNQTSILRLLDNAITSRKEGLAVLLIGVDQLDSLEGQPNARDYVMRVVSERLRRVVRPSDALGRYNENEFLAILVNVSDDRASQIAREITRTIASSQFTFEQSPIGVTCSVGCVFSENPDIHDTLIAQTHQALSAARKRGGNTVHVDSPFVRSVDDLDGISRASRAD